MSQIIRIHKHNKIHIIILNQMLLKWECGIKIIKKEESHLGNKFEDK